MRIAEDALSTAQTGPPSRFISSAGLVNALTKTWILAILWAGVLAHLWKLFETLGDRVHRWDFSLYYLGSYAQSHGINPYTANLASLAHRLGVQSGLGTENFDPPSMVIAMEPFTWMSVTAAYWTGSPSMSSRWRWPSIS